MIQFFGLFGLVASLLPGIATADAVFSPAPTWGFSLKHNYTIETVIGFFAQDLNSTDSSTFDFISSNFGLISDAPFHWQAFDWSISQLNKQAPRGTSYRVLYLARHGEGWHNVAESTYGTAAWDDHWSKLNSDGNMTWGPDAELTPNGIAQAQKVATAWKAQYAVGIPLPQTFYSSPLTRSSDTLKITFGDWLLNKKHVPQPVVLEGLRESIGVHTCDKRRTKTFIHNLFPTWYFEKGFTEEDGLWTPDDRETSDEQQARAREALVEILNNDDSTYISITSHSGTTAAILRAIGHRAFSLQTGAMIPVVIKTTQK